MARTRLRILVAGRLASVPGQGGAAWATLQWILGFRSLGHEVLFVESITRAPDDGPLSASPQARYFRSVVRRFGLADQAALTVRGGRATVGMSHDRMVLGAGASDLLVDLSGVVAREEFVGRIPVRLYVDLDPGFTQLWHSTGVEVGLSGHTHYATVGHRIGDAGNAIPDCGKAWIKFLPPVALDHWPMLPPPARESDSPQ